MLVAYLTTRNFIHLPLEKINRCYTAFYQIPVKGWVQISCLNTRILNNFKLQPLSCPPAMKLVTTNRGGKSQKYLLRGDSEGYVTLWTVPDISIDNIKELHISQATPKCLSNWNYFVIDDNPNHQNCFQAMLPTICTSLSDAWELMNPSPVGILDQLNHPGETSVKLTASIYLPQQSRLVVGREDGSIIIVPATQTVMLQLLHLNHQNFNGNSFILSLCWIELFRFFCDCKHDPFRLASASNFIGTSWSC